jgi:hypothetical protein
VAIGEYGGGYGTSGFARSVSVSPLGNGTYMGEDLSKKPARLGAEDANKVPSIVNGQVVQHTAHLATVVGKVEIEQEENEDDESLQS